MLRKFLKSKIFFVITAGVVLQARACTSTRELPGECCCRLDNSPKTFSIPLSHWLVCVYGFNGHTKIMIAMEIEFCILSKQNQGGCKKHKLPEATAKTQRRAFREETKIDLLINRIDA